MIRHRCPLADRGSPGRTHGNAVTNPRIRVCSTVVLTALPPAPRTRSILPQPVPHNGVAHPRPTSLTTNIRVPAWVALAHRSCCSHLPSLVAQHTSSTAHWTTTKSSVLQYAFALAASAILVLIALTFLHHLKHREHLRRRKTQPASRP